MRLPDETVYLSLYVLNAMLVWEKRCSKHFEPAGHSAPATPEPKRQLPNGWGVIPNIMMISERPVDVEDGVLPGHWEDLILGAA